MDQVRQALRYHHYAYRTEQAYCDWIVRFIKFHGGKAHPRDMGKTQIDAFLSHRRNDSASTQRQAVNALVFLYKHVLDRPMEGKIEAVRARKLVRLPVVASQEEVQLGLHGMKGVLLQMAKLLYGGGLRLMECVRMRVKDLDFDRGLIMVRVEEAAELMRCGFLCSEWLHAALRGGRFWSCFDNRRKREAHRRPRRFFETGG